MGSPHVVASPSRRHAPKEGVELDPDSQDRFDDTPLAALAFSVAGRSWGFSPVVYFNGD